MKSFKAKIMVMVLISVLVILVMPFNVFASNEGIQIVKTENQDYIIYVEDLENLEFKFAISQDEQADENDLDYIKSVQDGEGNQVILISKDAYEKIKDNSKNYIYIKNGLGIQKVQIDFTDIFEKSKMEQVEKTTKRIKTELVTNLEERNEEIDGIKYTETVGGLKIVDAENATYYYERVKLPTEKFSELEELANKLNTEYEEKDMYSKIEFAKEFYNLYEKLINEANWKTVENNEIRQPIDAQKGEQYVVLLKEVAEEGIENYDAKFLISYREDKEEKIPGRTETIVVQETAKLPITGDSLVLFVLLAVIVIALIFVFIRIKKIQNKEGKH